MTILYSRNNQNPNLNSNIKSIVCNNKIYIDETLNILAIQHNINYINSFLQ